MWRGLRTPRGGKTKKNCESANQQVAAMEQRAKDINLPYDLYYIFPQTSDINATDAKKALKMGLPVERFAVDIHIGAGGAIESARSDFESKAWFYNSAVNLETNAGTHDMKRALQVCGRPPSSFFRMFCCSCFFPPSIPFLFKEDDDKNRLVLDSLRRPPI